jgi:hypothetical protein
MTPSYWMQGKIHGSWQKMQLSGDEFMAKFSPLGLPMRLLKGGF